MKGPDDWSIYMQEERIKLHSFEDGDWVKVIEPDDHRYVDLMGKLSQPDQYSNLVVLANDKFGDTLVDFTQIRYASVRDLDNN